MAQRAKAVDAAVIIRAKDTAGRGDLLLLAVNDSPDVRTEDRRCLLLYRLDDDLDRAWRKASVTDAERPPYPGGWPSDLTMADAYVEWAVAEDVFPDRPGVEIIASHEHSRGATAVRVYDLDLNVLFEFWHVGALDFPVWVPERRLLVLSGWNTEVHWIDRGVETRRSTHPPVVLGVTIHEIQSRREQRQWLRTSATWGTLAPRWYWTIGPYMLNDLFTGVVLAAPVPESPDGAVATLTVHLLYRRDDKALEPDCSLSLSVDEEGRLVEGGRKTGSNWAQQKPTLGDLLPAVEDFELMPLPPRAEAVADDPE